MSFTDDLQPVLGAPAARAVAFLDPQGEEVACVGDRSLLEVLGAYGQPGRKKRKKGAGRSDGLRP